MYRYFAEYEFLKHYRKRSSSEAVFHMFKVKFGAARALGFTL